MNDIERDVAELIDWWREANEAPGGCSPREAIDGMRGAIMRLAESTGYLERERLRTDALEES